MGEQSIRTRSLGRLAALDAQTRADYLRRMCDLWAAGLEPHIETGTDWPRALWDSVEDWYAEVCYGHVAMRGEELVGFQLVSHRRTPTHRYVVVNATAVRSDLQGSNIGFTLTMRTLLAAFRRERTLRFYITSRVFSPLALAGAYKFTPDRSYFFPQIDPTATVAPRVRDAAVHYVETYYPDYEWDPITSLISGTSEKRSPAFRSRAGDPLIDTWWDTHLADGGASVLMVQGASMGLLLGVVPSIVSGVRRMVGLRRQGARKHHEISSTPPAL